MSKKQALPIYEFVQVYLATIPSMPGVHTVGDLLHAIKEWKAQINSISSISQ